MAPRTGVDVLDLWELPQDAVAYLDPETADRSLWADQAPLAENFRRRYFSPWDANFPLRPKSEAFWMVSWLKERKVYGQNRRPVPSEKIDAIVASAGADFFPALDLPAIIVRPSALRALPSNRPFFLDPAKAGEGFPFDYLQNSGISANTPVRVRHRTPDGAWVYVDGAALYGWLPAADVAIVDDEFMRAFRTPALAVLVRDGVPVADTGGVFRFSGRIGTFFPVAQSDPGGSAVLVAAADADGRAVLRRALLSSDAAPIFPLPATPRQLATIANRIMGEPYGWGDLYGDRDCSSTLRDLYAPFGLWLPRNSSTQAQAGRFLSLEKLTPEEREKALRDGGVPWRTLVWMNGHIMLYVGQYQERPALFHTFWGVRTRNGGGEEGRRVIGRTVVTSLQPGRELPDIALPEGDLRHRIRGMTFLGEK
jgi:cell wall-associated NlpC family hydrolase